MVVFNVVFHRACDIPENIRKYKEEIRKLEKGRVSTSASSTVRHFSNFGAFLHRHLRSVRQSGISIGGFYSFQSVSTMEYCDFVFCQAIGLLLTYRDPIAVGRRL